MSESKQENMAIASDSPPWYVLDIILVGFLLLHVGLLGPGTRLLFYLAGLRNDMALVFGALFYWVMLLPLAGIVAIAVVARMVLSWPKRIANPRRMRMLRRLVVAALVADVVLVFVPIVPPGHKTFTWGFKRYAQAHLDVLAVRSWLNTLDPNLSRGEIPRGDWPEAIVRVHPSGVYPSFDEAGRSTIRLYWYVWEDDWGVEIGPEDMEIPATQPRTPTTLPGGHTFYEQGEYRLPLAPGAYVWHNIE
jgi:hypothetical protein